MRALQSRRFSPGAARTTLITEAEKTEKDLPSIAETKDIAEEGFIYGLPIVMNYAVMYEFCVDKNSGQYKGPVQPDHQ